MHKVLDKHVCGSMPITAILEYWDKAWRIRVDSKNYLAVTYCPWCGEVLPDVDPTTFIDMLEDVRRRVVEDGKSMDCAFSAVLDKHYPESFEYCSEDSCDDCREKSLRWLQAAVKDMCYEQETE